MQVLRFFTPSLGLQASHSRFDLDDLIDRNPLERVSDELRLRRLKKRRLLLRKKQIRELWNNIRIKGNTVVPTKVYLKDGRAKIEIALAKGKKAYDKRATIAKRDEARDNERATRVR